MTRKQATTLMVVLSMAYGTTMAVLSGRAADLFAVIGAGVLAIGWVSIGMLYARRRG